jgi:hypothetical protein
MPLETDQGTLRAAGVMADADCGCLQGEIMKLFLVKSFHTLVFLVESAAILYILYSGLFDVRDPGLVVAIGLVAVEGAVFVLNGFRCPLTPLARSLGDATGNDYLADIFLPEWFAPLIPRICGGLMVVGLILVGLRFLAH